MILVCDHTPRDNFVHFEQNSVISNGQEIDGLAMCNNCFALPVEEVMFSERCLNGSVLG